MSSHMCMPQTRAHIALAGCGHIRLMLDAAVSSYYSVNLGKAEVANCVDIENAAACVDSKVVAAKIIDEFFR